MNKEEKKIYNKLYQQTHREHIRFIKRRWREENVDRVREYDKKTRDRRNALRNARRRGKKRTDRQDQKAYYKIHKDKIIAAVRAYNKTHKCERAL